MSTAIVNPDHTYITPGGARVPGISSVLRAAGLLDAMPTGNQEAMDRGSRVHRGIELQTIGELDEATIDPGELELVMAADRWRKDLALEIMEVERGVCNEALGYGTAVDLLCRWQGKLTIVNWKTGGAWPHYPIQMALEALCFDEPVRRLAIYLGKLNKQEEYTAREDFVVARACATVAAWKRARKGGTR